MKKQELENILQEHHRHAFIWARQCCSFDDHLAQDVLQQVYLKILEGRANFQGKSTFKTWLYAVIKFTASEWRKADRKVTSLDEIKELPQFEEAPPTDSHEELIMLLPKRQQEVLLLVFYHNLTLEKAAEVMKISVGSVRTHYDRGKKNLKELIIKKKLHEQV